MDVNKLIADSPWDYFGLPPGEEQRLRALFTDMVGPLRLPAVVDAILLDPSHDNPLTHPEKVVYGIGNTAQIAAANLFIVGDFIAQYHKLGKRYRLPLLPKEMMGIFRHPYNLFQDLNWNAQSKIIKALNKKHKRGLVIDGIR